MKSLKFVYFRIVDNSVEIFIILKVFEIEITKMLLFRWFGHNKFRNDALPAKPGQRCPGPPLLYNAPKEPLVASNCEGINRYNKQALVRPLVIRVRNAVECMQEP